MSKKETIPEDRLSVKFRREGDKITRTTVAGQFSGKTHIKIKDLDADIQNCELPKAWAIHELRQKTNKICQSQNKKQFQIVDIFCGSGGLSLGVKKALEAIGLSSKFEFACDASKDSMAVYKANFRPRSALHENALNLVSIDGYKMIEEYTVPDIEASYLCKELQPLMNGVDIFVAGPPCEGNSNLNNQSRRIDPRNELYVLAALIGAKLNSGIIILENVPAVKNARQSVVKRAEAMLEDVGYKVINSKNLFFAYDYLVAQTRRRHFLVAIKSNVKDAVLELDKIKFNQLSVLDAIRDLEDSISPDDVMLKTPDISHKNKDRIDFLFDHSLYNLPDDKRPDCHKLKEHNYGSVYGRMKPDEPAPTITTGFQSPGRGRFIHPTRRRGLTPREGARIQGFPDYFYWNRAGLRIAKQSITRLIGDAVPPNLGMFVTLAALAQIRK